jgi:hypothetical protein
MVQQRTWTLIILLVALVGLSFYLQRQKSSDLAAPTATSSMSTLFGAEIGEASTIRIENAAGDAVEIARSQNGKWLLIAPSHADADQAAAEAAATQVSALRSLSTVRLAPAVVGLDQPAYTITVTFVQGGPHELLLGSETPIQDGYYAQLDKGTIQVVDKPGLDGLMSLLKTPPYLATPTPFSAPTPLASPATTLGASTGTGTPVSATNAP